MAVLSNIAPIFLDAILGGLVPWLLIAAGGDPGAARQASLGLLASYDTETEQELALAGEIACHSFAALDALARSANPDLSLNQVLRLRGSANSSQRSQNQCHRRLQRLRQERLDFVEAAPAEQPKIAALEPAAPVADYGLSRPQRRAVERAVVKAQRKIAERDRVKAMRAARAIPSRQAGPDRVAA